jgi:superfamily II DNA or RNA helicase
MILRPYQEQAVAKCLESMALEKSALLVLATGLGKTQCACCIAKHYTDNGARVMFLAHRDALIYQAANRIGEILGFGADIEMADQWADKPSIYHDSSAVVVGSIQTQIAGTGPRKRMHRFSPDEFGLLIIDEAHRAAAVSYRKVVAHYQQNENLHILGLTATPKRHDELGLNCVFKSAPFVYGIQEAVKDGWLVEPRQSIVEIDDLDISKVSNSGDDFNGKELAAQMEQEKPLFGIAFPTIEAACGLDHGALSRLEQELGGTDDLFLQRAGRIEQMSALRKQTLVFAASVAQAEALAQIINRWQPSMAVCVSAKTPKDLRKRIIRDFRYGNIQYLVNVGVYTEGFDEPQISLISMGRPTKSSLLYQQMLGRGTRPLEGIVDGKETREERLAGIAASAKPALDVIDFTGNCGRHKLVTAIDVLAGDEPPEIIELAKAAAKADGEPRNIRKLIDEANIRRQQLYEERQEKLAEENRIRDRLTARVNYRLSVVNPFDCLNILPPKSWTNIDEVASQKQIDFLLRAGFKRAQELTKRQASALISEIIARRNNGGCTYKQAQLIKRFGYPTNITCAEATRIIDALAKNGWRRPKEEPKQEDYIPV